MLRHFLRAAAILLTSVLLAGCPTAATDPLAYLDQYIPPPDTSPIDTNPAARQATLLSDLVADIGSEYAGDLAVSSSDGTSYSFAPVPPNPGDYRLPSGESITSFFSNWTPPTNAPPVNLPPGQPPPSSNLESADVFGATLSGSVHEELIGVGEANSTVEKRIELAFDRDTGGLMQILIPGNILVPDVSAALSHVGDTDTISGTTDSSYILPMTYSVTATLTQLSTNGDATNATISLTVTAAFGAASQTATGTQVLSWRRSASSLQYESTTRYAGTLFASAPAQPSVQLDFVQELHFAGALLP